MRRQAKEGLYHEYQEQITPSVQEIPERCSHNKWDYEQHQAHLSKPETPLKDIIIEQTNVKNQRKPPMPYSWYHNTYNAVVFKQQEIQEIDATFSGQNGIMIM